jgi:hypothetical protein
MPRHVLLIHDLHPHFLAFRAHAERVLGDAFAMCGLGSIDRPALNREVLGFIRENPDKSVFVCEVAMPFLQPMGDIACRSFVPVAHPVSQTLRRYEAWGSRAGWLLPAEAKPADGPRQVDLAGFLRHSINRQAVLYPLANLQLGVLSGGRPDVPVERAVPMAAALSEAATVALVDFPHISIPMAFAEMARVGAPLRGPIDLSFVGANALLDLLRDYRDALPPELFATICAINAADLAFYDEAARIFRERAPIGAAVGAIVETAVGEAAEITKHRLTGGVQVATPSATRGSGLAGDFVEADPVLGWRLRPNAARELTILGRKVPMENDDAGYRPVPGQPKAGDRTLAVYGCSTVYGWSIAADETCCAELQTMFPEWRVENHGAPGYGQVHNLIQLERDSRWESADFVTFGWIGDHLRRNTADAGHMRAVQFSIPATSPVETFPRAYIDRDGTLAIRQVAVKRPDLLTVDLADFEDELFYKDLVCFHLFKRAAEIVRENGGHFFVTLLWEQLSPLLMERLAAANIPVLDASVFGEEYQSLPDDGHANAKAHRIYAEKIRDYLLGYLGEA